jgi:3-hydroxyacyl-CoA dehydrogenase/enoyl-CoA hydratase/3-hydroxybutyryl-CoA epimerase
MENFKIDIDSDGFALVTFDSPGKTMNTVTVKATEEILELAQRFKTDAAIKGVVIASGKANGFCAGADLNEMLERPDGIGMAFKATQDEAQLRKVFDAAHMLSRAYRALETCGKPIACAIEGLALGGGLELALACHYRVVADDPKIKLGLPEAKVGILPGAGGTQRLPRLINVQAAAMMILKGEEKNPQEAKALGFVSELAAPGKTIEAAKAWLKTNPSALAPWDVKGFRIKGGPQTPDGAMLMMGANAMVSRETSRNFPAQKHILSCLYEGLSVPIDAGLRIETRYFVKTAMTPQASAMIRSLFISMQALSKGGNRPAGIPKAEIKKVGVIGAGLMGAGIAYVQAKAGIETVLLDVAIENAEKGKDYSRRIVEKEVSRGKTSKEKGDALLALITPTTDYAALKDVDLVIEAVYENPALKAEVTKKIEAVLPATSIYGSNTSTLPITGLAEASVRPDKFIGIHFFSPVERMALVEIIMGEQTTQETLAKAIDYVLKIRKTPIVVNDHRGFYTSRCFSTYCSEGIEMLMEGIAPTIIENVGRQAGMPMGSLEVSDSVSLDTMQKVSKQLAEVKGGQAMSQSFIDLMHWIVDEQGRIGRKGGKGFYEYGADGKPTRIWPDLAQKVEVKIAECSPALKEELTKRLLFRQCVEVARCFEEDVITDPRDADVGSILAWGFAPYTGGCVSYIDLFWGAAGFVKEADRLADQYGERFRPNALLRDMAAKGETFYGRFGPKQAKAA